MESLHCSEVVKGKCAAFCCDGDGERNYWCDVDEAVKVACEAYVCPTIHERRVRGTRSGCIVDKVDPL